MDTGEIQSLEHELYAFSNRMSQRIENDIFVDRIYIYVFYRVSFVTKILFCFTVKWRRRSSTRLYFVQIFYMKRSNLDRTLRIKKKFFPIFHEIVFRSNNRTIIASRIATTGYSDNRLIRMMARAPTLWPRIKLRTGVASLDAGVDDASRNR